MTIKLYNNESEANKVNKVLTNTVTITGTVKDPCEFIEPTIVFDMGTSSSTYLSKNYAYISEFGRYYFITKKTIEGSKLIRLQLKVDVLMTYASQIMTTPALIDRSELTVSPHIIDSQRAMYNCPMVLTKQFSSGFDGLEFYLTTAG